MALGKPSTSNESFPKALASLPQVLMLQDSARLLQVSARLQLAGEALGPALAVTAARPGNLGFERASAQAAPVVAEKLQPAADVC